MAHESLVNRDWQSIVDRLGGATELGASAKETKAFLRPREIKSAVDLLRMILAYCLGEGGLRSTAAWAASIGLVDISNEALSPAPMRGLACTACRPCFDGRSAESGKGPADPHYRWHHCSKTRKRGQDEQQAVAYPRRFRSADRTLWPFGIDGRERRRNARSDTRRKG